MQRPGANTNDMQPSDFLCDFCHKAWDGAFPLVEGHQGSLVCGNCLTIAYTEVVLHDSASDVEEPKCALCLEHRDDPCWQSPAYPEAFLCRRCMKQAAGRLHKDPDWEWQKPSES